MAEAFTDPKQPVIDARAVDYGTFQRTQDSKEAYAAARPLDARLSDLHLRTLVLFGGADQVFNPRGSAERYAHVPRTQVEIVPNAGHSPMLEAPGKVAQHVRRFVRP